MQNERFLNIPLSVIKACNKRVLSNEPLTLSMQGVPGLNIVEGALVNGTIVPDQWLEGHDNDHTDEDTNNDKLTFNGLDYEEYNEKLVTDSTEYLLSVLLERFHGLLGYSDIELASNGYECIYTLEINPRIVNNVVNEHVLSLPDIKQVITNNLNSVHWNTTFAQDEYLPGFWEYASMCKYKTIHIPGEVLPSDVGYHHNQKLMQFLKENPFYALKDSEAMLFYMHCLLYAKGILLNCGSLTEEYFHNLMDDPLMINLP